jgi:phosphogluconate dehydratase
MSGAAGKVPAAIHVTPEAYKGGLLAKVHDGDLIELNTVTGELTLHVDEATLAEREAQPANLAKHHVGMGREMFAGMRAMLTGAEEGACSLFYTQEQA